MTCWPLSQSSTNPTAGFADHLTWKTKSYQVLFCTSPKYQSFRDELRQLLSLRAPPHARSRTWRGLPFSSKVTGGAHLRGLWCHWMKMPACGSGGDIVDHAHHDSVPSFSPVDV